MSSMFSDFIKFLEIPVILHKSISDENILLLSYHYNLFIIDRNDIVYVNYGNNNMSLINITAIPSTVIKELYISNDTIIYKYLEEK